jgi:hypothetical protein
MTLFGNWLGKLIGNLPEKSPKNLIRHEFGGSRIAVSGLLRVGCHARIAMSDSCDHIGVEPGNRAMCTLLLPLGNV